MSTTPLDTSAPIWPAAFHGVGFAILQAADGTYEAVAQGGYRASGYASPQAALVAVTAWIVAHWG